MDMNTEKEKANVRTLLRELNNMGYQPCGYDDGGDYAVSLPWIVNAEDVIAAIYAVDECTVYFRRSTYQGAHPLHGKIGSVFLVLGNSPEEVVADYGGQLEFTAEVDRITEGFPDPAVSDVEIRNLNEHRAYDK